MFFVVAILTEQFEIVEVQSYLWIVDVVRIDVTFVVNYVACITATLTHSVLLTEISISASSPRLR